MTAILVHHTALVRLQEAALAAADTVDPLAARIGAVNTLVRQPDGTLRGYNTDCGAALDAIEAGLAGVSGTAADDQVGVMVEQRRWGGIVLVVRGQGCLDWHAAITVVIRTDRFSAARQGRQLSRQAAAEHSRVAWLFAVSARERRRVLRTSPMSTIGQPRTPPHCLARYQAQDDAAGSSQRTARRGPLDGRTVVVVGAGGAGRALAFGAVDRGAQVHSDGLATGQSRQWHQQRHTVTVVQSENAVLTSAAGVLSYCGARYPCFLDYAESIPGDSLARPFSMETFKQ